ncbi:MAG: hypothetical protein ACI9F9_001230 [Candidatus Paceibacteria bacterium]|jgi:hypothetical protein
MARHKRKIKLIKPRFQNQLTLIFMGISSLGILMQCILFYSALGKLAADLPSDGSLLMEQMNGTLLWVLGITLLAILPLTYVIGVLTTFRVAGPMYRMEKHLRGIAKDGYTGPCTIRKGDKLQGLVEELNVATRSLAAREAIDTSHVDSAVRKAA